MRRFYQAGGLIAMGTDAGTPFNFHGANALELAYMVDIGISPSDAMVIATRNAADLLSLDDCGTIAAGKQADLLLVDGNPGERVAQVAEVENHRLVMKAGQIVYDRQDGRRGTVSIAAPDSRFTTAASAGF